VAAIENVGIIPQSRMEQNIFIMNWNSDGADIIEREVKVCGKVN
jgi:hypothetical protein